MAALLIDSVTIPVAPGGWREVDPLEVGEVVPAFDGTLRDARRDTKRRWQVTTRPLSAAEYTAVRTALEAASPLSCDGDILGSATNCVARVRGGNLVQVAGGFRRSIEFELMEE